MAEQSHQDRLDQVATTLTDAVHITHDLWGEVEDYERLRGVVLFARHCLGALELGKPEAAGEALSKMDDAGR